MIKKSLILILFTGFSLSAIGQENISAPATRKKGYPDIPGTFTLELGVNRAASGPSDFSLGLWGSRSVNVYYQYDIRIMKSKFSVVPGIGLSLERYKFKGATQILEYWSSNQFMNMVSANEANIAGLKKSQLITNYVDVPVELRFSSRPEDPARSFHVSVGGRIGYMFDSFTKMKYTENGSAKKAKEKQDYNLNKIRYGLSGKIGIGNFSLFTYYNLSPLFEKDKGLRDDNTSPNNFSTFTVGISLSSF